jgi:hypothetical protein
MRDVERSELGKVSQEWICDLGTTWRLPGVVGGQEQ